MSTALPTHAQVVVIGGGIVGFSTAYHLTKEGFKDVLVLERKELGSGTTSHSYSLPLFFRAIGYFGATFSRPIT